MDKEQINKFVAEYGYGMVLRSQLKEWFKQNPIEPVVVGLSDSQVDDLVAWLSFVTADRVRMWLKTQTFTKPIDFSSWYNIKPKFNMQPDEVTSCHYNLVYTNKYGDVVKTVAYSNAAIDRPKSAVPRVEVGQVWIRDDEYNYVEVEVIAIGYNEVVIRNKFNRLFVVKELSDFLDKFERVL